MIKKLIYLVRHGDIGLEGEKRFIGQTDLPLSAKGLQQAEGLQRMLAYVDIDAIYCSDLKRSVQTAEIIAARFEISPITSPELREISLGDWEGRAFTEIAGQYPQEFIRRGEDMANYRPPGGESFAECSRRVIPFLEKKLLYAAGNILIVGHAGVNRVLLAHMLGLPLANLFRIAQDYGCLSVIQRSKQSYCLKELNVHLLR